MSSSVWQYARLLSACENKGQLDLVEERESSLSLSLKVQLLATFIRKSRYTVVHTGAGISTKAGVPDFRDSVTLQDAVPTVAHLGIAQLCRLNLVHYIVTQNVDGLHRKSEVPEDSQSELHGCMFVIYCNNCKRKHNLEKQTNTVGFREIDAICDHCGSTLYNFVLDWNDEIPKLELEQAINNSKKAELNIVIGSSLQMLPSKNFCLLSLPTGGKLVIINLSRTSQDHRANMILRGNSEECLSALLFALQLPVSLWVPRNIIQVNPLKTIDSNVDQIEWHLYIDCHCKEQFPKSIELKQIDWISESSSYTKDISWLYEKETEIHIQLCCLSSPTLSMTFEFGFTNLPSCTVIFLYRFHNNIFPKGIHVERFSMTSVPSYFDVMNGFRLAYGNPKLEKLEIHKQMKLSSYEWFYYKSDKRKRYSVCLICKTEVPSILKKKHFRQHWHK
eukprot:jgi/Galph1/112/GphlegSOOS_G4888.1